MVCDWAKQAAPRVLNASRRHCLLHSRRPCAAATAPAPCSTPRGVTAFCTLLGPLLSAAALRCSTPRGVTAFCTQPAAEPDADQQQVLNASRRHCLLHSTGPASCGRCSSAQRLAASLPSARGPPPAASGLPQGAQRLAASLPSAPSSWTPSSTSSACAQRLAASLPSARRRHRRPGVPAGVLNASRRHCLLHGSRDDPVRPPRVVLNASRRHCLLHPSGQVTRRTSRDVLNASRRHCLLHIGSKRTAPSLSRCSTPRGVTAFCTDDFTPSASPKVECSTPRGVTAFCTHDARPAVRASSACVLNASRRHCLLHPTSRGSLVIRPYLCSTPRGVTAFCTTRRSARPSWHGPRAQRLAASLPSARSGSSRCHASARVLNASRRHCLLHGPRAGGRRPGRGSAQRLAASLPSAQPVFPAYTTPMECSTPRGVTAFCTRTVAAVALPVSRAQRLAASLPSAHLVLRPVGGLQNVLNASRRHCLLHGEGADHRPPGARVLNASRRHCLLHRRRGQGRLRRAHVLNASRRHCLLHGFGGAGHGDGPLVLNASRRHCLLHPYLVLDGGAFVKCSTPRGVTAFCTGRRRQRRHAGGWVLNASRRHCLLHPE